MILKDREQEDWEELESIGQLEERQEEAKRYTISFEEIRKMWDKSKEFQDEATKMIIKHKIHFNTEDRSQYKDTRGSKREEEKNNKEAVKKRMELILENLKE